MTNPSPGPSLVQARGSELHHHSLIHRRHDSTHGHHHHRHQRPHRSPIGTESGETAEQAQAGHETGVEKPSAAAQEASVVAEQPSLTDASDLELSNGVDPSENYVDAVKSLDSSSPTEIVQNASLSPSNSTIPALYLRTAIETSETLLAGSVLGNTVAIPTTDLQATAATPAAALDTTSGSAASEPTGSSSLQATTGVSTQPPPTTDSISAAIDSTSSQASDLTSISSSGQSIYPTIGDLHNGTNTIFNVNSSFVPASSASSKASSVTYLSLNSSPSSVQSSLPASNSSRHRVLALSSPTALSFPTSTGEPISSTTVSAASTQSDESSIVSTSASTSTSPLAPSDVTSTYPGGGFVATAAAGGAFPPPSSGANANAGGAHDPETQKVRIIGGVFGSVAGVALAVLVLLALRYKKRRDVGALLGDSRLGSTASGTLTGGDLMAMTERSRISAVTAPFSSLTQKRNSRPPNDSVEQGGERGFYRVAGRKLPPVLVTGGDGYSDPRESVMSGGSDYHRGSQAFDLAAAGSPRQLALGVPMRPVSGVPIMRSGPARTPVTENPFVDPLSPTQDMPNRRPVSRASASKFHEGI